MNNKKLIVITGPTASGKSALAVSLARYLNTEIISADSRQIYQGIPIVTAVPTIEEKQGIKHHLLEILSLEDYFSASLFAENSKNILNNIFKNHDFAIICGGSMLYIDALINGIDDLPTIPSETRENLMKEWGKKGDAWLLSLLNDLDKNYFERVDHKNLKRVFHAIEVTLTAGKPYSSLLTGENSSKQDFPFDVFKFCLSGDRENLFDRINTRVLKMIEAGLEEEALKVYPKRHLNSLNTVGLKEIFKYFDGDFTKEEAIAKIQKNTRVYAKKQLTWHKRDKNIRYLDFSVSQHLNIENILNGIQKI